MLPVSDLILHIELAPEWHCPPWIVSGRDAKEWRNIYMQLQLMLYEAKSIVEQEEEARNSHKND